MAAQTPAQKKASRRVASERFWAEISKTRLIEPDKPDGVESYRSWARRLDIDINNLLKWENGSTPSADMLMRVINALGLPRSEFFRLLALAEPTAPDYVPADRVPLYASDFVYDRGTIEDEPVGHAVIAADVVRDTNASRAIIAIQVAEEDDTAEPQVQRGSVVFVDTLRGKDARRFMNGALYAVVTDPDAGSVGICSVIVDVGEVWLVSPNRAYEMCDRAWTTDLERLIVGRVFHIQSTPSASAAKEIVNEWKALRSRGQIGVEP